MIHERDISYHLTDCYSPSSSPLLTACVRVLRAPSRFPSHRLSRFLVANPAETVQICRFSRQHSRCTMEPIAFALRWLKADFLHCFCSPLIVERAHRRFVAVAREVDVDVSQWLFYMNSYEVDVWDKIFSCTMATVSKRTWCTCRRTARCATSSCGMPRRSSSAWVVASPVTRSATQRSPKPARWLPHRALQVGWARWFFEPFQGVGTALTRGTVIEHHISMTPAWNGQFCTNFESIDQYWLAYRHWFMD